MCLFELGGFARVIMTSLRWEFIEGGGDLNNAEDENKLGVGVIKEKLVRALKCRRSFGTAKLIYMGKLSLIIKFSIEFQYGVRRKKLRKIKI